MVNKKVGYLGPPGTYSEQAARILGEKLSGSKLINFPTIPHILKAVETEELDIGIVPVENSIEGTVNITLDMLALEVNLFIQGEIILNISHCLHANCSLSTDIHTIFSHPQALAQCRRFLLRSFPQARYVSVDSTAEAARLVKEGSRGLAAVGSLWVAEKYSLELLFKDISDYEENQTRFLIIGREKESFGELGKTSLCILPEKNKPGGLYEILGEFKKEEIDLLKIESRPAKNELGNYLFFIDCRADLMGDKSNILINLKKVCKYVKILGCYGLIK